MLVDVVNYGGEFDVLLARLDCLDADVTVLVEGDRQFQGQVKGWTFEERRDEVPENFTDRLWHVAVKSAQDSNPWVNEAHQRDAAIATLQDLDLPGDAIMGVFDVDEFPDPNLIRMQSEITAWNMSKFQMSLYWYQQDELTGFSGAWDYLRGQSFQQLRMRRNGLPAFKAGFHFSSFGDLAETLRKWDGFSHTELKRANMGAWVEQCWREGRAIENGQLLQERNYLDEDFPKFMLELDGPSHWYRRRGAD